MTELSSVIISVSSWLTLAAGILTIFLLVCLIFPNNNVSRRVSVVLPVYAIWISFFVSVSALVGSLIFSNILGFDPCNLCWMQRIFMYSQVVIFAVALWKKDIGVFLYALPLSIIGGLIALYQSYLQFGGTSISPCDAAETSCTKLFFIEFGYVTIPTMSLTAFALLIIVAIYGRKFPKP